MTVLSSLPVITDFTTPNIFGVAYPQVGVMKPSLEKVVHISTSDFLAIFNSLVSVFTIEADCYSESS